MRTFVVILAVLFFISHPTITEANECDYAMTPCEAYANADAVFIGKVIRIIPAFLRRWRPDEEYDQTAYISIEKSYKGYHRPNITLHQLGRSGGQKFIVDERYLFYANYDRDARIWEVKPCGRTSLASYIHDDVRYLDGLSKSLNRTRIAGEVVRFNPEPGAEKSVERLSGIKVKFITPTREYEATTDAKGLYEIYDLPPGKYIIKPEIPKGLVFFAAGHYGADRYARAKSLEIELKEKACSGVMILLTPQKDNKTANLSRRGRILLKQQPNKAFDRSRPPAPLMNS